MYRRVYFCAISIVTALALAIVAASEAANRPQYGSWGFDTEGEDSGVKPGDDFFAFANGHVGEESLIPADKSRIFLLSIVSDSTEERLRGMMERAAGETPRQPRDLRLKMGAFYKAFMNDARVEQLGARPIGSQLAAVRAAVTREKLAVLMGRNRSDFEGTLFQFYVDSDLKNPTQYALHIGQGGLGLPDRDYYLTSNFSAQKTSYERYAARLLSAVGWPGAASRAKEIVELKTRIAEASWSKTQQRDPAAVYNPVAVAELEKFAPDFAWDEFLKSLGIPRPPRLIVLEKSAVPKLAAIFAQTPVPTLQAWQAFQIADDAAPYLSHDFALAWFELHEKSLGGQVEQRARWKRGITAVSGGDFGSPERFGTFGTMGFGVGEVYLGKYFGPRATAIIETLVSHVKAAFRVRLERSDWMGPQTKAEALKKLDTYDIKVAGPVHPRDYSNLVIRDDDLVGDVQRAGAADWAFDSGRISDAVDRTEWKMTPQTADA